MGYRLLMCFLVIMWISHCPSVEAAKKAPQKNEKQTLMDVYAESVGQSQKDMQKFIEKKLTEQQTYGYVKPYVPVIQQPVVRKVWVPDHKSQEDPDILVAGHWTYVMVEGPKWFIDTQTVSGQDAEIKVPLEPAQQTELKGK